MEKIPNQAHFFDIDGLFLTRDRFAQGHLDTPQVTHAVRTRLTHGTLIPSLMDITNADRWHHSEPDKTKLGFSQQVSLWSHQGRSLYPEVIELIPTLATIYKDPGLIGARKVVYGINSGRYNHRDWWTTTVSSLEKGGSQLLNLLDNSLLFFRPERADISSKETKWLAIKHFLDSHPDYQVTQYDDDPEVAFYIAEQALRYYPEQVKVVLVERFPRFGRGVLYSRQEQERYRGIFRRELSLSGAFHTYLLENNSYPLSTAERLANDLVMQDDLYVESEGMIATGVGSREDYRQLRFENLEHGRRLALFARLFIASYPEEKKYFPVGTTNDDIDLGFLLHDIGKADLPLKPSIWNMSWNELTDNEKEVIRRHVTVGQAMMDIYEVRKKYKFSQTVRDISSYHHERLDGSGYLKVKGRDIPYFGKLAVIIDQLISRCEKRSYRGNSGLSLAKSFEIIWKGRGKKYDERILGKVRRILEDEKHLRIAGLEWLSNRDNSLN